MDKCRCVKPKRMLVWDDKYSYSICPKCGQWWKNKAKWVQREQRSFRVGSTQAMRVIKASQTYNDVIQNLWRKLQC